MVRSAATNLTPVVAELGGKSANIVFADADLDAAAMLSAHQGPLMQSGQSCACASRILVHDSVYDPFVEKFLAVIAAANIGDPFDPSVTFGPVISAVGRPPHSRHDRPRRAHQRRRLLFGGNRIGGRTSVGLYVEPTVFGDVDNASTLAQTETFGPVVCVIRFVDDSEAVRHRKRHAVRTERLRSHPGTQARPRVARQLEAGSVWVNTFSHISPQGPYGGYKQSGFGRTGGVEGLHEFLQIKNIRIGMVWLTLPVHGSRG